MYDINFLLRKNNKIAIKLNWNFNFFFGGEQQFKAVLHLLLHLFVFDPNTHTYVYI